MTWKDDDAKTRAVDPEVQAIIRQHLNGGSTVHKRVRLGTAKRYGHQFTMRASRQSGIATELHKVLAGTWTHYFYGHATADGAKLERWVLLDLAVFRRCHHGRGELQENHDRSSGFMVYRIADFPADLVIAQGELVNPKRAAREQRQREKAAELERHRAELEHGQRMWRLLEDLCE